MVVIINSRTILKEVKDFQVSANKGGIILSARDTQIADNFEDILKTSKIKYLRFGHGTQFEIDCYSISAIDDIKE